MFDREGVRLMNIDIHRNRISLTLCAVAVLAAVLLVLVSAKSAWAASRTFVPAPSDPFLAVGATPTTVTSADFDGDGKVDLAVDFRLIKGMTDMGGPRY